jgi:hypothetical protein
MQTTLRPRPNRHRPAESLHLCNSLTAITETARHWQYPAPAETTQRHAIGNTALDLSLRGEAAHALLTLNRPGTNGVHPQPSANTRVSMSTPALAAQTCACGSIGKNACGAEILMTEQPGLRMETAPQVDVDHGLKAIGRNPQRWRGKIACRAGNQHIEVTLGLMHLLQGAFDRRVITSGAYPMASTPYPRIRSIAASTLS